MRPGYLTFDDARGSGLRHFPADTHVTDWLEAKGIAYDVMTDEDIDEGGAEALEPYATVLTGSHPEYHTTGTLDALEGRSEEHTSELQSLMRISYAVFCLKKKTKPN